MTKKIKMAKRYKHTHWIPTSLQAAAEVIEFDATEPFSNLGLTIVQYSIRRQCSDEKERVTVRINSNSLREIIIYLLVKMKLCLQADSDP